MSFEIAKLNTGMQLGKRGEVPVLHSYKSTTDAIATIMASTGSYFSDIRNMLTVGDYMHIVATDVTCRARVNTIDGTTVIMAMDSVLNASGQIKSSADAALVYGLNLLDNASGVNQAYTLPSPPLIIGGEVEVALRGLSSTVTVIDNSTAATIGTGNTVTLTQAAPAVKLRAVSTSRWDRISGAAAIS